MIADKNLSIQGKRMNEISVARFVIESLVAQRLVGFVFEYHGVDAALPVVALGHQHAGDIQARVDPPRGAGEATPADFAGDFLGVIRTGVNGHG